MDILRKLLAGERPQTPLAFEQQNSIAAFLSELTGANTYAPAVTAAGRRILALGRDKEGLHLYAVGEPSQLSPFDEMAEGSCRVEIGGPPCMIVFAPANHAVASVVREVLPWTAPTVQGLHCSVGLGDRLGLATPGHVRAVHGTPVRPYFAQQSAREMTRTQRTPEQIVDAATWGVMQAGWQSGFGSDADHLKEPADVDACAAAGFTMFTIDPGEHVRSDADTLEGSALVTGVELLPWGDLEAAPSDLRDRYLGKAIALEGGVTIRFDQTTLARAIVKYGGAVAHTVRMYRHIRKTMDGRPFELEVSVDETATPTSSAEHYLVAAELKRLGVQWVGLAPRFVGDFEKGIDYKGDLRQFDASFAEHVAVARTLGPYKLSIHSGSDKFSIYPAAARIANGLVHLKTAGTSYLEALRVLARKRPDLMRQIVEFAFSRFDTDRKSYHVSARLDAIARPDRLKDGELEAEYLDKTDGRQLLHVTFGSVLTAKTAAGASRFRADLLDALVEFEEEHYAVLGEHLGRHVRPFVR